MKLLLPLLFLPLAALANALQSAEAKRAPDQRTAAQRWADVAKAEAPSFRRHVIPLFSRAGCSGRECHGAFAGQGGFQLSLFGYDFDKDHKEIVADAEDGSRIDTKKPADSLVLTKPSLDRGETHKGKKRFDKGAWEYNLVLRWIQEGAKIDVAETGEFAKLEVTPQEIVFKKKGDTVQLKVMAHWADGTVEDVTQLTRFRTNDESVADVSATGLVTCKEKGDTHIVAFYDNGVHPVPAMLPASEFTGAKFPTVPTPTKVDALVVNKLRKAGIVPSEVCTDAEFLRRVSLDMTGTLPTPDDVRAFLADQSADKRAKKVEALLKTPGYAAWWTTLLCDFGGNTPRALNTGGDLQLNDRFSRQWYDWIYKRVAGNEPYDKIVAGIVLAKGRTRDDQTYEDFAKEMASYFREHERSDFAQRADMPYFWQRNNVRRPQEKALAFAHTFLGVRIECAECHKHPFDQWTQTDFKQFQAFFEPVAYGGKRANGQELDYRTIERQLQEKVGYDRRTNNGRREYRAKLAEMLKAGEIVPWQEVYVNPPRQQRAPSAEEIERRKRRDPNFDGRVFTPKILGGDEVMLATTPDPREPLMEWLRSKENPYFAQSWVNRVWAVYFGRGIVEPADDMNLANPPTNKELMDYLAAGFIKSGYDMKWLHREIVNSDTYQRSWKPTPSNKLDDKNFSHARIRRLPAEHVFDAIAIATASSSAQAKFAVDLDNRAIGPNASISGRVRGGDNYTLNTFGKPSRNMNCDCERTGDPTLLQTIFTRNDPMLLTLLDPAKRDGSGWIEEMRRATDPNFSPERLQAELAKLEAGKGRVVREQAERAQKPQLQAEKDRQKYEGQIKELDQRIERAKAELAAGPDRLESELKKLEGKRERMAKDEAERARKSDAQVEKDRQKFEAQLREMDQRVQRAKADLVAAQTRKPIDLERAIEDVFYRTVSRPPTQEEIAKAKADVAAAANPAEGVRELLWAMLNTREFMVNH